MKVRMGAVLVAAMVVVGGGAGAAQKAPAQVAKVEVVNTVQTSEVERAVQPDPTVAPCAPGSDNRNSDLCAQWKAADATREATDVAMAALALAMFNLVVGAVLGGATLYFLVKTFEATAANAQAAKSAAEAAEKAVIITEQQGAIGNRAWLSVETKTSPFIAFKNKDGNIESLKADITCQIKNTGKTPAIDVRFYVRAEVFSADMGTDEEIRDKTIYESIVSYESDSDYEWEDRPSAGNAIFPGGKLKVEKTVVVKWADLADYVQVGRPDFMISGCVIYKVLPDQAMKYTGFVYSAQARHDYSICGVNTGAKGVEINQMPSIDSVF